MKKRKRIVSLVLTLSMVSALLSGSASSAAKLSLNRRTATLYVGQSMQLKAKGRKKVLWTSSNPSVVSVSRMGKCRALSKKGTAVITAKKGKNKASCKVTVKNAAGTLFIKIGSHTLSAKLEDNSSARALAKWVKGKGTVTVPMRDYSDMEKVGSLGTTLPTNDKNIKTKAGDLILYQGNQFVIYYDKNEWELTKLGKIQGLTAAELRSILGSGNVVAVLSLKRIK